MAPPWLGSIIAALALGSLGLAQTTPVVEIEEDMPAAAPADRFWFRADYLLWKVQGVSVPALAGSVSGIELIPIRVLPDGVIHPLWGGTAGNVEYGPQSGFRLGTGVWLDEEGTWGVEAGYFQLLQARESFSASAQSGGTATVGPTFFDPVAGREVLIMSGIPGFRNGSVTIDTDNRLWGVEANARWQLATPSSQVRLDLLAGFRQIEFDEDLQDATTSAAIPGGRLPICGCQALHYLAGVEAPSNPGPVGDYVASRDSFAVRNLFYGPQFGMTTGLRSGSLWLNAMGKLGLGVLHSEADLNGATITVNGSTTVQTPGGVLVQATNRGRYTSDSFAVAPEVGIIAGWDPTAWLRLSVGYNYLFLSDASRAAKFVDAVDSRQVPQLNSYAPASANGQPAIKSDHSGVSVQGLVASLEFRF